MDRVSGFTIDRADMDSLLLKWFDGNYLDIMGWKEKAAMYEKYSRLITLFGHLNDTKILTEIQENSKKWDALPETLRFSPDDGNTMMVSVEKYDELVGKAKNYDELIRYLLNLIKLDKEGKKLFD